MLTYAMIFCRMAPPAIHSVEQSVAYEELGFCDSSHLGLAFSLCFPQSTHPTLIWDPSMSWKPRRKEEYRESVGASHILRRSFRFCVSSQICLLLGNPFPLHSDFPILHMFQNPSSALCAHPSPLNVTDLRSTHIKPWFYPFAMC